MVFPISFYGINLRDGLKYARIFGCQIRKINASGASVLSHTLVSRRVRFNDHQKPAPRSVSKFLEEVRYLQRSQAQKKGA